MNKIVFKKGFDKMNLEEYKKHVNEVNDNIENLLKNNEEELNFYHLLVKTFNQVCEERNNLEQALDKIEKHLKNDIESCNSSLSNPEYTIINKHELLKNEKQKDIDILKIIQKAKGDVKNEN